MSVRIGTSGFSYKEWKTIFYPADLSDKKFLSFYATKFDAVEIDSTFYRMPTPSTLEAWMAATPPSFRFAIKSSQKITHRERLRVPSDALTYMLGVLDAMKERLGVVLYQLPPNFRQDLPRLQAFLEALPPSPKSAVEFRHLSWFAGETYRLLEKHGVALCINDTEDFECPLELTARHTYVRLRKDQYLPEDRIRWKERLRAFEAQSIEVFAFIKHKDNPDAPIIALDFAGGFPREASP